jgi:thiosulfate/3-mercaptopyruvate sulfurtransferase
MITFREYILVRISVFLFLITLIYSCKLKPADVSNEPWNSSQLMEPAKLADQINKNENLPVIYNIGPSGRIKTSIYIGSAGDEENLQKLKTNLTNRDREETIVIYCGCCPFKDCPNIRPAFSLLKTMDFEKPFLLNLPDNLKTDWIDKGYPME